MPVTSIAQDREGFLWIGTQEGLNRFDGLEFQVYENQFDEPDSLSSDWVWDIYVDSRGALWVGTEGGGLNRFERASDSFTHFRHDPDNPRSLSSDRVRVIYEDSLGAFWIGTDGGGLNRFDPASGEFVHYRHDPERPDALPHDTVLDILEDRAGNLWVGTNGGGLSRFDRTTGTFINFQHDPNLANSISGNKVRVVYEDRSGRLWIATYDGGVNLFDPISGGFRRFMHDPEDPGSLSSNRVRSVFQDHQGTLWFATDAGLNEWRPLEQGFVSYTNNSADMRSISDDRVTTVFQDRGGVLWVGTYYGVNKWNYLSDAFTYYKKENTRLALSHNVVTAIDESNSGEYWIGTYGGGLNRIDIANGAVTYYARDTDSLPRSLKTAEVVEGVSDNRIMAVHVDSRQRVWIGTRANGLSLLDPESGAFTHYRHDPDDAASLSRAMNARRASIADTAPTAAGSTGWISLPARLPPFATIPPMQPVSAVTAWWRSIGIAAADCGWELRMAASTSSTRAGRSSGTTDTTRAIPRVSAATPPGPCGKPATAHSGSALTAVDSIAGTPRTVGLDGQFSRNTANATGCAATQFRRFSRTRRGHCGSAAPGASTSSTPIPAPFGTSAAAAA